VPALKDVATLLQQGEALQQQGKITAAEMLYQQVLALDPKNFDALCLMGVMAAQANQPAQADEWMGKALELDPSRAELHFNRGVVLQTLQRQKDSLDSYDNAIAINPDYAEAHFRRGLALQELQRPEEAISSYGRAIAIRFEYAAAHFNRGNALFSLQRIEEALRSYDNAIALQPHLDRAHCNRGNALWALNQKPEALASYDHAIAINPNLAEAYSNRGNVLHELRYLEEAVASYAKAIAIRPDYASAHSNCGIALQELKRFDEAMSSFDSAIGINPEFALAYWHKSLLTLRLGLFEEGWGLYEWRWKIKGRPEPHFFQFTHKFWLGNNSLSDKTILLHAEQGLGDTIQFCRYAKLVKGLGATVLMEVPKPLVGLLSTLEGVDQVIEQGSALPAFDYHCPLMSLPLAFQTRLDTIPSSQSYLHAEPTKVAQWQKRLGPALRPRVGLVWSGGFRVNQPELWALNKRRNLPLDQLKALQGLNLDFISLQKGEPAESEFASALQAGWEGPAITNYSADLQDFSDTAALIETLDLVISVDTSVAHLAAALGKQVWILNRFDSCWRWLKDRTDSPWYPTVTLYNQRSAGDWEEVMHMVRQDLIARSG
jgi:tetratricopeptide (TPR) repeat protein